MKSITIVAIATCLLTLCTSFATGRPEPSRHTTAHAAYYWYLTSDNSYQGDWSTSTEIDVLEEMYDVYVDTDPSGTLLASGYGLPGYPHSIWPSVNLYGHF